MKQLIDEYGGALIGYTLGICMAALLLLIIENYIFY